MVNQEKIHCNVHNFLKCRNTLEREWNKIEPKVVNIFLNGDWSLFQSNELIIISMFYTTKKITKLCFNSLVNTSDQIVNIRKLDIEV